MWEIFEMLLKRDGVSIADVSRATGISQPVFSNWKKRRGKISAENAQKIADYFNVSVGFIFGVQEDEQAKEYFADVASAETAQQMFDDPQLRALHHIKQNTPSERFLAYYKMIESLYRAEHPDDDYNFDGGSETDRPDDV